LTPAHTDAGFSLLEVLVGLAILAGATTMIVGGIAPLRTFSPDPIDTIGDLLAAARSETLLSGTPILVRLRTSAIEIGGERHDFSAPIGIGLADKRDPVSEVSFFVLPDGTRTGGRISLTSGQSRTALPLLSRGTGT
jgi:prepilin-type N-terminal cleavage/methylation domain-containing protein